MTVHLCITVPVRYEYKYQSSTAVLRCLPVSIFMYYPYYKYSIYTSTCTQYPWPLYHQAPYWAYCPMLYWGILYRKYTGTYFLSFCSPRYRYGIRPTVIILRLTVIYQYPVYFCGDNLKPHASQYTEGTGMSTGSILTFQIIFFGRIPVPSMHYSKIAVLSLQFVLV